MAIAAETVPAEYSGDLDKIHEYFRDRDWTDGLPIIPPTARRVEEFLAHTTRDASEVLGVLPPEMAEASIHSIAVNGVMAGCRADYMPILVAIVEAMCDPLFRLADAGATPGWEILPIVCGPIVDELDFNFEAGVMRTGRRANTSIGRFVRLFMRNVPGFRIPPGDTDKGSFGLTFPVALPESPRAIAGLGWPSHAEDRGFPAGSNVVTLQSLIAISCPMYTSGPDPYEHLLAMSEMFGQCLCKPWTFLGIKLGLHAPVLVIGPLVARVFADAGITKDDVRQFLHENTLMSAWELEAFNRWRINVPNFQSLDRPQWERISHFVPQLNGVSREEAAARDWEWSRERNVPVFPWPEQIVIVVAGDPYRNQSRGYLPNHRHGATVTRLIERSPLAT